MVAPALRIDFDDADHRYLVDGEEWISVTTALSRVGLIDFSGVPRGIREAALSRGRRVHAAAHYLTEGTLDWDSVAEEEKGYVEAAAKFLAAADFLVAGQERRIAHPRFRYAGTMDIFGWWDGSVAVADYKTGDPQDVAAELQLAAYAEALRACPPPEWFDFAPSMPIKRISVRLTKHGRYSPEHYTSPSDFGEFLAALTVAHAQMRRGLKGLKVAA